MRKQKAVLESALVAGMSVSLLLSSFFSVTKTNEIVANADANSYALEQQIQSSVRAGYIPLTNIEMGQRITESLVTYSGVIISSVDQSKFISENDLGKVATVDIPAGMPIYTNMVSDTVDNDIHERECSFIWLNTNLQEYDYVDVRILFPNGEDYVVCAKKSLYDMTLSMNNVFLWLTEEEILLLDSAIVDANMHNGKIYVTKYVKPEVQQASAVTYSPNSDVMRLIASDENIVERSEASLAVDARSRMDERLELFEQVYPGFTVRDEIGSNTKSYQVGPYTDADAE